MIEGEVDLQAGDIVRVRGWRVDMKVIGCNYYMEKLGWYVHHGIVNPVHCTWREADGEHEAWFRPDDVTLVRRPAAQT